jgi:hypothetical protein
MPPAELPKDYAWAWDRETVRVSLPPLVETEHHVFEPVLSRTDARRVVAAIWDHATGGGRSGLLRAPTWVELVHDPRFGVEALAAFRERVAGEAAERGLRAVVVLVPAEGAAPSAPAFPPEPVLPPGFDPGSDTDMGAGELDLAAPEAPAPEAPASEPPASKPPSAEREAPRLDRPSRQGATPSWRRRFEKRKKK